MHGNLKKAALIAITIFFVGCGAQENSGPVTNVEVSGQLRFADKLYNQNGFTGDIDYKTLRFAIVDLVDGKGRVQASTESDANGNYRLSGSGSDLYVRVLAQTSASAGLILKVADFSGAVYAVTQDLSAGDGQKMVDMDVSLANDAVGAFNILDVYSNAGRFISNVSNQSLADLSVYWQNKSNRYGTYHCSGGSGSSCPQGRGIYIYGGNSDGSGDTDHFDDDVLWHEFAHYLEYTFGILDSPGGRHYLTDNDSDLRLAWSEGLGGFFPGAVKTWLAANDPARLSQVGSTALTRYIDSYGSYAAISMDMAAPSRFYCPGGVDCFTYSSSEVAVAKVLLDVDAQFGMAPLLSVLTSYMRSGTAYHSSLETFWDGWQAQRSPAPSELAMLRGIFDDRQVYYQEDSFEQDGSRSMQRLLTPCVSTNCSGEQHYLYRQDNSSDVDIMAFSVQAGASYTVETYDLSNGADTALRVLDAAGQVVTDVNGQVLVNDDRADAGYCQGGVKPCVLQNDAMTLSSALAFQATQNTDLFLEVRTSQIKPAAAGRYGSYRVRIIQQ